MRVPRRDGLQRIRLATPWASIGLAAVLLLTATTSCTGSTKPPPQATTPTSPTTTTISSTTGPTSIAQAAVISAYNAMWMDMAAAAKTANYQNPVLANHASGAALSTLVRGLYSYQRQGWVINGTPVTHPRVISLSPTAGPVDAAVIDCFDDTHWLVYKSTGGLADNTPGGHRKITANLQDRGGVWKVTTLDTGAEGTC